VAAGRAEVKRSRIGTDYGDANPPRAGYRRHHRGDADERDGPMLSLRIQIVFFVLVMSACVGIAVVGAFLHTQQAALYSRTTQALRPLAERLAAELAEPVHSGNSVRVRACLRAALATGVAIGCATVLDDHGALLAEEKSPAYTSEEERDSRRTSAVHRSLRSVIDRLYLPTEVTSTVYGPQNHRLATVHLLAPVREANELVVRSARSALWAFLLGLSLVALGTYVVMSHITTPLTRCAKAMIQLGNDDFDVRVPIRGPVQLAVLSHGVNRMAERLRSLTAVANTMAEKTSFINNVVDSMVDSLIVVDEHARITAVNQATVDLLGYSTSELVGRSSSMICVADGFHLTSTRLEQLLGEGALKDHEVCFISRDNRHIPISLSGSAIKDGTGRTTGYVCLGTDITHRKEAEAEREKLNRALMTTSRQAGMAEVATGVLHNVGNVLNSVNVSAAVVEEAVRRSKVSRLAQLAELLSSNAGRLGTFLTEDARGKMVPTYLGQLARHLLSEQEQILAEMTTLTRHIGHIKDIISVQQSVSKVAGVVETADPRSLVEDALRMVSASIMRSRIVLERDLADSGSVETDKHKVLQILVNLLTNALDSVREVKEREGTIIVRLRPAPAGADGAPAGAIIEVLDNGTGIPAENLTRIFTHGFTTKKKGHGFGLHSAANAARELQGSLTAHSDGPGGGARFVLTLPARMVETGAQTAA
jgi:PAS domain S-box-containing protein